MREYPFRIINVFAEERLAGNPLCVFERADGIDAPTMQALALQFNLSETVFLLPSEIATARIRIFTPEFEMPFAGHPTLGSAHVVRELFNAGDRLTLETQAGVIPVVAGGDRWTLQARNPVWRSLDVGAEELAAALGVAPSDLGAAPLWVSTGSEQLIVPLSSPSAVRRCRLQPEQVVRHLANGGDVFKVYVWAEQEPGQIVARFFFPRHGSVVEDPGTGSACANLGGWWVATNRQIPVRLRVDQGEATGRRCVLALTVDEGKRIFVGGRVVELGRGSVRLD